MSFHEDTIKTAAAKFLLNLKEKYKLTQVSLDYTVKAVEDLLLLSNKRLENPFEDLKTECQQNKFFKENFGLIVSWHVYHRAKC